jgi:hypothetical protein
MQRASVSDGLHGLAQPDRFGSSFFRAPSARLGQELKTERIIRQSDENKHQIRNIDSGSLDDELHA